MEEAADRRTCNRLRSVLRRMSPARIRLLSVLASGTEAPIEAAQKLGVSPVTVYHHLTVLKTLGLVQVRRVGRSTLYSLSPHIDAADLVPSSGWPSRPPEDLRTSPG
jgi:DNA-binding transcriptional ArsR family regulator